MSVVTVLLQIGVVALLGWVAWGVLQPPTAFVVQIRQGRPRATRGRVTDEFLNEVRQLASQHGIGRATVRGVIVGDRISLRFSSSVPPGAQQQLRNWWAISGWPAGRQRPRTRERGCS